MTRHTAIYCRISRDRNGRAEGVEAQERWGRDYAASAWPDTPVIAYIDNDISAANGDHRPGYEALREAIRRGDVAHLWCVEQSRLERREVGWFVLAAELVSAGITELHTNRDGIVRIGEEIAGIKAVLNAGEVRKLTRRINDRLAENAANGTPPGSVPFGYVHGVNDQGDKTYVVVPEQADAIRWAAERVLAGWSLANVAAGLREQGLTGAHGGTLSAGSVRSMLTKPTIAGWRVHSGRTVGRGNWEAILDEDTWQACRARLSGPRTVQRADGTDYPVTSNHTGYAGRRYTLTGGLAVCGVCGAPLIGSVKQLKGGRRPDRPYLLCHKKMTRPDGKPAGSCVGIMADETEGYVADRLFAELDRPEFLAQVAADDHAERRAAITKALKASDRKRAELAEMWADGDLTSDEWKTARRAQAEAEQRLRAELAAVPPPLAKVSIEQARASWGDMTLDERREFLRLFIERVTIGRAKPGTRGFDEGRVSIEWRTR
jgi:site-specific DNA recombinase